MLISPFEESVPKLVLRVFIQMIKDILKCRTPGDFLALVSIIYLTISLINFKYPFISLESIQVGYLIGLCLPFMSRRIARRVGFRR